MFRSISDIKKSFLSYGILTHMHSKMVVFSFLIPMLEVPAKHKGNSKDTPTLYQKQNKNKKSTEHCFYFVQ